MYDVQNDRFPDSMDESKFPSGQQDTIKLEDIALVLELGGLYNAK